MRKESSDQETTEKLKNLAGMLQAVHDEDKNEMASICEEKLQLSECLDRMASEIINLNNSIANKDKQKENPHLALEDGAALRNMLDEIERGHHRAEELETKIERLQKKFQKESDLDVNNTVAMQNAWQALYANRLQLAEKTNEIDPYTQALRNTTEKLEGLSDESQDEPSNAFEIAGKMRNRLQECDKRFACLENNCQGREEELDEVQCDLEATICNLSEAVGSRDAHIKELEKKLFAKEREVQATQQQLQKLELAIDANESRAQKLELDLKDMSTNLWQINMSSPPRTLYQV